MGRLVARNSGATAPPTPNAGSMRPPLRKSIVAHSLASTSGSRNGTTTTFMPNLSRSVAPASAAIVVIDSRKGCAPIRRSVCQIESTSPASHCSTQRQKPRGFSKGKFAIPRPMRTLIGSPYSAVDPASAPYLLPGT